MSPVVLNVSNNLAVLFVTWQQCWYYQEKLLPLPRELWQCWLYLVPGTCPCLLNLCSRTTTTRVFVSVDLSGARQRERVECQCHCDQATFRLWTGALLRYDQRRSNSILFVHYSLHSLAHWKLVPNTTVTNIRVSTLDWCQLYYSVGVLPWPGKVRLWPCRSRRHSITATIRVATATSN